MKFSMNAPPQPLGNKETSILQPRGIRHGLLLEVLVLLSAGTFIAAMGGWRAVQSLSLLYLLAGLAGLTIKRLVPAEFSRASPDYS
jgi:hypothetical protein